MIPHTFTHRVAATCLASLAFLVLIVGCIREAPLTASREASRQSTVYERVISSGVIRAGYVPYPPAVIVDPNTKQLSGIFVEALEKAAANLNLKVEWSHELNWQTQIEEIRGSSRIDIIGSSSWANSARGKQAAFLEPLYYSGITAWVRSDDHRFDSDLMKLNDPNVRISVIDGDTADFIARSRFPKAQITSLPQSAEYGLMLQAVADSKADVTFIEPMTGETFSRHQPGTLRNLTPHQPLVVFPNSMMVKNDEVALKSMLDTALRELLNSGYVDELIKKYVPDKGAVFPVSRPYRADDIPR